jgi:hypothetical protein
MTTPTLSRFQYCFHFLSNILIKLTVNIMTDKNLYFQVLQMNYPELRYLISTAFVVTLITRQGAV